MPNPSEIESQISSQIQRLGTIMYLWMGKTNNWGGFTSAAIVQHHCYHLLEIPLSTALTAEHLKKFEEKVSALSQKYELDRLNADELQDLIKKKVSLRT